MKSEEIQAAYARLKARIEVRGECWIWTGGTDGHGYGHIRVGSKAPSTHRLAYLAVHGPIPRGKVLRHTCDRRLCCNPEHLIPGDHEDNTQDIVDRGRNRARRVLTDEEITTVGVMRRTGATKRQIAEALQVNWYAVSRALDGLGIGRGKGGRPKGSRNVRRKFNDEQQHRIAQEYHAGGITQVALAAKWRCDQTYISLIVRRFPKTL